jgi:hypothetical protein
MDIFFTNPGDIPLPPADVHIRQFTAEPWPDRKRVRVYLEVTPFQKHPNGEICIINQLGKEVASISVIETIDPKMEFTLHLRDIDTTGDYTVRATVFYLQEPDKDDENHEIPIKPRDKIIVDQAEVSFTIEN